MYNEDNGSFESFNNSDAYGVAAVQAVGSLGSSLINAGSSKAQREWSEKMYERGLQDTLEQWNRTNVYNSPLSQKQRMVNAGLNPLYYGLDGSSADAFEAPAPQGYQRFNMDTMSNPLAAGVNGYMSAKMQEAQIDLLRQQSAKVGEETTTEVTRRQKMEQEIETEKQRLNNMLAEEGLTDAKRAEIEKALEWYDKIQEANLAYTESQTKYTDAQKNRLDELLEGEKLLQAATLDEFEERWNMWQAQAEKDRALAGLTREDIANYGINHMTNGVAGSGISLQNFIRNRFLNYDGSPKSPNEVGKTYKENREIKREERRARKEAKKSANQ